MKKADIILDNPTGLGIIANERVEQIEVHGYPLGTDDPEKVLRAADAYLQYTLLRIAYPFMAPEQLGHPADHGTWPTGWPRESWKPGEDVIHNLAKAGALIAAAIDSLKAQQG